VSAAPCIAARRVGLAVLSMLLVASCTGAPEQLRCVHRELGSTAPDTSLQLDVAEDAALVLTDAADRIDLALTMMPPVVAPIILVHHSAGGQELSRRDLKVTVPGGISTRCSIGSSAALSSCAATPVAVPSPVAGRWSVEPNGNHVLEFGMSVRLCR